MDKKIIKFGDTEKLKNTNFTNIRVFLIDNIDINSCI